MARSKSEITLKIFTHYACEGCGPAVEMAWNISKEFPQLLLETVKLDSKEGLATAQLAGIKTIPTLIYYNNGNELKRFIGLPKVAELRETFMNLINDDE